MKRGLGFAGAKNRSLIHLWRGNKRTFGNVVSISLPWYSPANHFWETRPLMFIPSGPKESSRTAFLCLLLLCFAVSSQAQTKRALLIGINHYVPDGASVPKVKAESSGEESRFNLPHWTNLQGSLNDVAAMRAVLTGPKFAFPADDEHMHVLSEQQATRRGILEAMELYLVQKPDPGDLVVFYYAGHGSMRLNSKSQKRESKLDNTIVPADAISGEFDVRDREIARIFHRALDKGVRLTAIFDSCHSGSIARGIPLGDFGRARVLGYDPRDISEGPDMKDGKPVPAPEDRADNPALVFSATQSDQLAREGRLEGEEHGAFTVALIEALNSLPADTPAIDIFRRVKVVMQGWGLSDQQPTLGGPAERLHEPLFGKRSGDRKMRVAVAAKGIKGEMTIRLEAGYASGLGVGSQLKSVDHPEVRLRVNKVETLSSSIAETVSGKLEQIQPGDLFEVTSWVPPAHSRLRLWMPPAITMQALTAITANLSELRRSARWKFVDDPTLLPPTHFLSWDGHEWTLSAAAKRASQQTAGAASPDARPLPLGARITAAELDSATKTEPKPLVYVNIPPVAEWAGKLKDTSTSPYEFVDRLEEAQYILLGSLDSSGLRYTWARAAALASAAAPASNSKAGTCSGDSPYPPRTDWARSRLPNERTSSSVAAWSSSILSALSESATGLARIRFWLELPAPENTSTEIFPYELALRDRSDKSFVKETAIENHEYDLVLRSRSEVLPSVESRFVYVLGIDCTGHGQLLFPLGNSAEGNLLPTNGHYDNQILLTTAEPIVVEQPLGLDTYILLSTKDQLPDPTVLNFDSVLTRGPREGTPTALEELLGSASAGTRAATVRGVPTDWGVQYLHVRSLPESNGSPNKDR